MTLTRPKNRHDQRGSAMTELALSVLLLMIAVTGVIEFARLFYTAAEVANAARAGVEWGLVNPGSPNDLTAMQNAATTDAVNVSGMTATASEFCQCDGGTSVSCTSGTCPTGQALRTYVKVVTSAAYTPLGSYWWMPSTTTINSQATIRVD